MRRTESPFAFYFSLLDKGVDAWNQWRKEYPEAVISLEGVRLSYLDLKGVNFAGIKLDHARFQGNDFRHADFTGAYLRYANMKRCMLDYAIFTGSNSACMILTDSPTDLVIGPEGLQHALSNGTRTSMLHARL